MKSAPPVLTLNHRRIISRIAKAIPGVVLAISAGRGLGQTLTWSGSASDHNWSDANNWVAGIIPSGSGTETVDFPAAASPYTSNQNINALFPLNALTFENATTLEGNAIQLDDHTTISTSANVTVDNPIEIGANMTVNGAGDLTMNGPMTLVGSPSSGLTMAGTGVMTLSTATSAFTFLHVSSGSAVLSGGSVKVNGTGGIGLVASEGMFVNSASLTIENGATLDSSAAIAGDLAAANGSPGMMTVTGGGTKWILPADQFNVGAYNSSTLTVSGGATVTDPSNGAIAVGNGGSGTVLVDGGSSVTVGAAVFDVESGDSGALTVTDGGSVWNCMQVMDLGGYGSPAGSANINIASGGGLVDLGPINFYTNTSSLTVNGGTVVAASLAGSTGSISLTDPRGGTALTINGAGGTAQYSGSISGFGTIVKTGGSTQALAGTNSFQGTTVVEGGSILLASAQALQYSTIDLNVNNGLNVNGLPSAVIGGLAGSGNLALGTTTLSIGGNDESETYSGVLSATVGAISKVGSGTLTLTGSGSSVGGISVYSGGIEGGLVLSGGSLSVTSPQGAGGAEGLTVNCSSFLIENGATFNGSGSVLNDVLGTAAEPGSITISGAGTTYLLPQQLIVGIVGTGSLTMNSGAVATDPDGGVIVVAYEGIGSVLIEGGSSVTTSETVMGVEPGDQGSITVTGANSSWNGNADGIFVGNSGSSGTINVSAGGAVNAIGLTTTDSNTAAINVNGGTYTTGLLVSDGAVGMVDLQADPAGGHALVLDDNAASDSTTFAGTITGAGSLLKTGAATQILGGVNSYTGGTTVSGGVLLIGVNAALGDGPVAITGGTLRLGLSTGLATIKSLSISGNGTFDVNNNHVIINYGNGADPIASVAALLKTGYAHGAWNGAGGIDSSAAAANSSVYGLGYADAADPGNPAGLASGTIEIKYTLLGDANLSGVVDGTDFGIVAANFNKGVTGWDQGDFNYDGVVDGTDFGDLASNFNKGASGGSVGPGALSDPALVAFAEANGLMADVPEPVAGMVAILGLSGALVGRRPRRM